MNHSKKSTFISYCMQSPHDHEQSMCIGPSSYDSDKARRQKHRKHCQTTSHEFHNAKQAPLYHCGNGDPPSSHNGSSISRDSEVSSVYTCFACRTDGNISRFCSQMQSLADQGPDNNMLYPQGPPLLVNRDSHEQSMQASSNGHHDDKRDKPYIQPPAKPNRMVNRLEPTCR